MLYWFVFVFYWFVLVLDWFYTCLSPFILVGADLYCYLLPYIFFILVFNVLLKFVLLLLVFSVFIQVFTGLYMLMVIYVSFYWVSLC